MTLLQVVEYSTSHTQLSGFSLECQVNQAIVLRLVLCSPSLYLSHSMPCTHYLFHLLYVIDIIILIGLVLPIFRYRHSVPLIVCHLGLIISLGRLGRAFQLMS